MKGRFIVLLQRATEGEGIDINELNESVSGAVTQDYSRPNNILQLLGLIFLLVLILVAAYFTSKFVSKIKLGQLSNSNFEVIDTFQIATNRLLMIVKVGKRYILIAITKENVQFITELNEEDINLNVGKNEEKKSFKMILDNMKNKKSKG